MNDDYLWDKSGSPDPEVAQLEKLLGRFRYRRPRRRWAALVLAAIVLLGIGILLAPPRAALPFEWVGGGPGAERLRVGEWLTTGERSARLDVAGIGSVEVAPQTRLRLLATGANEHRLELAEGRIAARIYAPPRLFFVETPAATAVDLGCAYTLTVAPDGSGVLRVDAGFVQLENSKGPPSWVPRGARCRMEPGRGPQTPYFPGAAEALIHGSDLSTARPKDTLTLWHLLARTESAAREAVLARIEELAGPVARRAEVLALEEAALLALRTRLRAAW